MRWIARALLYLMLALAPCAAMAEVTITPSATTLAAGSVVDFTIAAPECDSYTYTLSRDGEELFTRETNVIRVSYLPRESGAYTLQVTAGEETAQTDITVTEPVSCTLPELPKTIAAGEPLFPAPVVQGGTGVYTYIYTISNETEEKAWSAGSDWHWVGDVPGVYRLTVTAMDDLGNRADAEASFIVTEGVGISVNASGGRLLAHGGQQSWTVFAPGEWSATAEDAFIHLDTDHGVSGGSLSITVTEETQAARQGSVTIRCGERSIRVPVVQSASQGVDEELSLLPPGEPVLVDGAAHAAWLNGDGARTFAITCDAAWEAATEDEFIHVDAAEGDLVLSVDEPLPGAARAGMVTISTSDSTAYVHVYQPAGEVSIPAAAATTPPWQEETFALYSQSSGYWQNKAYGSTNLQQSGCAIFALSHALQCLGFQGEEINPEALAARYAGALREGGTVNSYLVGHAADDRGFKTRYDLYDNLSDIRSKLSEGAVFSFAVVNGHIAMVAGQNEDGTMFRIIDSAPSATFERIQNAKMYIQAEDGSFVPLESLGDVEGLRYYIETGCYGGTDYWLEADYVTRRGVRLIQLREE